MGGSRSRSSLLAVLAAALFGISSFASGQGVDPGEVRPTLPAPGSPAEAEPIEVLPSLPEPTDPGARLDAGLVVFVSRFEVEGSTVFQPDDLSQVLAPWTGRSIDTEELLAARDALTDLYVAHGYVTSGAVIPDQDVEAGIVRLHVVEGVLSEVSVRGNRRFRSGYFERRLSRAGARPVNVLRIESALQLLQRDPWIERVDALLESAEQLGESRLVLVVTEATRWQAVLEGANDRSPAVGSAGGILDARFANWLGLRDVWSMRFQMTAGLRDVEALFEVPVWSWDSLLRFRFRDTHSEIIEESFDALDIEADARTYGISLFHPLHRTRIDEVWLELTAEHRQTHSTVSGESFCFEIVGSNCDEPTVAAIRIGGQWTRRTQTDVFAFRTLVSVGVDIFGATILDDSDLPDGDFVTWLGQAQWAHVLPESLRATQVVMRTDAQIANDPLLSLEKFAVGGHRTVRGYRENQLVRDSGVVVSGELRIPLWRDPLRRPLLELVPFVDYAYAWNVGSEPPQKSLLSLGAGLRFRPYEGILAEFSWGGRLEDVPNPHDALQDYGVYMSISIDVPTVF